MGLIACENYDFIPFVYAAGGMGARRTPWGPRVAKTTSTNQAGQAARLVLCCVKGWFWPDCNQRKGNLMHSWIN